MSSRTAKSVLLYAFVCAVSLSYGFMGWEIYRQKFIEHPDGWRLYLRGGIEAPWQYRIGPWLVVDWMNRVFRMKPYDTLTVLDIVCLGLALWVLFTMLRNSHCYKTIPSRTRWLAIAGVFCLAEYYMVWGHWFQTSDTLPSILVVTLSFALVGQKLVRNRMLASVLIVALGFIQGFIRADVAVVMHAGFFLALLFNRKAPVPFGRVWQSVVSLLTALLAGCVQLYLMLIRFPNAKYGSEGVVQLAVNLHPGMWLTMLLALFPYWLLIGLIVTRRYRPGAPAVMLLTASILYLAVWTVVGLLDEVRIFLPFAFALIPATVMALIGLLPDSSAVEQSSAAG